MSESPRAVLAGLPGWEHATVAELTGGQSNHTWLVEAGERKAVLKIDDHPRGAPYNSRKAEARIQARAAEAGLANRVLIAGIAHGVDVDALAHAMLEAHWRDDADLADRATLARLVEALGVDADALLAAADGADARAIYRANTDEAVRRSVFGSPTYFVDGDMFYGQDQLELVARAMQGPFAGRWPPADG